MTISPPISPDDDSLNQLANKLAGQLSSAFGYTLAEAETHIRDFYVEYDRTHVPAAHAAMKEFGYTGDNVYTAADLFWHDDSALVLLIGYRLAGGDTNTLAFLDWRKGCWDALFSGQRVPAPPL
jgi:hypothetical protein